MHPTIFAIACSSLLAVSSAAPAAATTSSASALPTCNPSYNYTTYNEKLRKATFDEISVVSDQAQMTGASTHIIGYGGYGDLIPGIVQPMTDSLNNMWGPALNAATIKCPACVAKGGKTVNKHPMKKPVLPYEILYAIFDVTTNMLSAINEKQCSVQGYTPPAKVQKAMRPFLDSIWKTIGTGPTVGVKAGLSSRVPSGAILPYYECVAKWAVPEAVKKFEDSWFALNKELIAINKTACVAH